MAKIYKAYDNQLLVNALQERDETYAALIEDLDAFDLDDLQMQRVQRYQKLTQFERDLIYLRSQHTVQEIADLYAVSKTIIYNHLKRINQLL